VWLESSDGCEWKGGRDSKVCGVKRGKSERGVVSFCLVSLFWLQEAAKVLKVETEREKKA